MQDKIQKQVLDAFFVVLRPIAKILLRYGIGFREFAEIAKSAFVDVATSEYGLRGRPTNMSRVAVMTGLTRKEVRRLRDKLERGEHSVVPKTTPLWDVLHNWHRDPEFQDKNGGPASLPFRGSEKSFEKLVRKFGGDIPAGAMRAELKRVGAVSESDDGELTAISNGFRPEGDQEILINSLMHLAYPALSTIGHNLDPNRPGGAWAQRVAFSRDIESSDSPTVRRICRDRIDAFSQAIDDSFLGYENAAKEKSKKNTVAVGVYYFEDDGTDPRFTW